MISAMKKNKARKGNKDCERGCYSIRWSEKTSPVRGQRDMKEMPELVIRVSEAEHSRQRRSFKEKSKVEDDFPMVQPREAGRKLRQFCGAPQHATSLLQVCI